MGGRSDAQKRKSRELLALIRSENDFILIKQDTAKRPKHDIRVTGVYYYYHSSSNL